MVLEQFYLYSLLGISNLFIVCVFILFILESSNYVTFVPSLFQVFIEFLFKLVWSLSLERFLNNVRIYSVYLFSLFLMILFLNLSGIIPYVFAVTSQFLFTLFLSICIWFSCIYLSVKENGYEFFSQYFPSGVPLYLSVLIVYIELISYIMKSISLGLRLGSNIMAGHLLITIVGSWVLPMFYFTGIFSVFPVLFISILFVLEFGICFIQAYVFVLLVSIYLENSIYIH